MVYHEILSISRDAAVAAFASEDPWIVCEALVRVAYHERDLIWAQEW